jgi:hypothetical protein
MVSSLMPSFRTSKDGSLAADFTDGGAGQLCTTPDPRLGEQRDGSGGTLADLFAPLDTLLLGGGDARIAVDSITGLNAYGCHARPSDGATGFSSSTATPISQRAFERAGVARDALLQSAITDGLEQAFDARIEAMREELKAHLGLRQSGIAVVFSASGTDAQLQVLFLTRALLGSALTTIVVAADQTGSGTALTCRGLHFGDRTSGGVEVRKGKPVCIEAGAVSSISLPLRNENGDIATIAECDSLVIDAATRAIAAGSNILLQVMDSSKLGWRAPSDRCVLDIVARWPGRVQVVVDACQMRSSRKRLGAYLERGYLVLLTGSKYFTGPAFSGAILVPAAVSDAIGTINPLLPQLGEYCTRSDWPKRWPALRTQFSSRQNFGQWLRWEAALEEMRAYYAIPESFRRAALATLGEGIARLINASMSLRLLPRQRDLFDPRIDSDELLLPTIFAFTLEQHERPVSLDRCKAIHKALAGDIPGSLSTDEPESDPQAYLVGQPVGWNLADGSSIAALRICIGARHVTDCWSARPETARRNLRRVIDRVAMVVEKLDSQLYCYDPRIQELSHAH